MSRWVFLSYGIVAYVLFLVAILYGIAFLGNFDDAIINRLGILGDSAVAKSIDGPITRSPIGQAIPINLLLLAAFALQHNVMARPWFKHWWTRIVPQPIERSTFVALASLLLLLLYWQWRPIPEEIWKVENAAGRAAIWTLYGVGWLMVFYSSFVIDHFELFGLKQVYRHFRGLPEESAPFKERSLYRWVRHPLMLGFLIAFWAAPSMTMGRLLFALVNTAWILFSVRLEERDLARHLGGPYRDYRGRTSMILPIPKRATQEPASAALDGD
jgi:protein-S-isoprenylcysteine O-methyltransferase Ste14